MMYSISGLSFCIIIFQLDLAHGFSNATTHDKTEISSFTRRLTMDIVNQNLSMFYKFTWEKVVYYSINLVKYLILLFGWCLINAVILKITLVLFYALFIYATIVLFVLFYLSFRYTVVIFYLVIFLMFTGIETYFFTLVESYYYDDFTN